MVPSKMILSRGWLSWFVLEKIVDCHPKYRVHHEPQKKELNEARVSHWPSSSVAMARIAELIA